MSTIDSAAAPMAALDAHADAKYKSNARPISIFVPSEIQEEKHRIKRFIDAMIYKLRLRAPEKTGFVNVNIPEAMRKLKSEIEELEEAIKEGNDIEILLEAADIANYALVLSAAVLENRK